MCRRPVGGLSPPLSSQLKLKPNDAAPVNPAPGGSCPPPRPVHAVKDMARNPAAATDRTRRTREYGPVCMGHLRSRGGVDGTAIRERTAASPEASDGAGARTKGRPQC